VNLVTHAVFGLAIGFIFFGRVDIAILIVVGSLLPDLDREYWFIPQREYREEQYHRALFHNIFFMIGIYLANVYASLGIFLHSLLDSFTTVKDRGCEWLFPISRLVKRGRRDANGKEQPIDPRERIYFYQEDPNGLLENADPDLRNPGEKPVPWRRIYGPALNGQILDHSILFGSLMLVLLWLIWPSHYGDVVTFVNEQRLGFLTGILSLILLYVSGELDRRGKINRKYSYVILFTGIALGIYSLSLYKDEILINLTSIFTNWMFIFVGVIAVFIVSFLVIKWHTRANKVAIV
jgi:hypothetical protein